MQYLKTHYGRAMKIPVGSNAIIPYPGAAGLTGLTTSVAPANKLIDTNNTFTTNVLGNIIITSTGSIGTVTGFVDQHTLILSANIASSASVIYTLYTPDPKEGCSIYIPAATPADIEVTTVAGDIITFKNAGDTNASMILTVQAINVKTSRTDLIALW